MDEKKKLKEENERLRDLLTRAVAELYEGAEDWFAEQIPDLIGSSREELAELGVLEEEA